MTRILTEEQKLIVQAARDFAEKEVAPRVAGMEASNRLDMDLHHRMAELGFYAAMAPESVGGLGAGIATGCMIIEEVSKASPALGLSLMVSMCSAWGMATMNEDQRERFLIPLMKGEKLTCTGATDPMGSTNHWDWPKDFGTKDGDDYILNGTKIYCTNSASADFFLVSGFCDNQMMFWIVEKEMPGFSVGKVEKKIGLHGNESGTLIFTNVRVPSKNVCSPEVMARFTACGEIGFVGNSAISLGCMEAVYAKAKKFAMERLREGKPLYQKQSVANMLAKMAATIEYSRSLMLDTCELYDAGTPDPRLPYMCKAVIPEVAVDVCRNAMEIHGGMGYCEDPGVARYVRDSLGATIADCTELWHYDIISQIIAMNPNW